MGWPEAFVTAAGILAIAGMVVAMIVVKAGHD